MAKRTEPARAARATANAERRRRHSEGPAARRGTDAAPRSSRPARDHGSDRCAPRTGPIARPTDAPARPKNAAQAKARAKARKAKAPKVVRPSLRERLLLRLSGIELNPRKYLTRVPFVVLVIGALGVGLGVTLWLSTDAAERSYQLGHARKVNEALSQQKEALERQVLEAQAAPALAESARGLGMIPSRDTAHLVQDPAGNWSVVGTPKPAAGVSPPPLNSPLPDPAPPASGAVSAPRVVDPREVTVHMPPKPAQALNPEVSVPTAVGPLVVTGSPGGLPAPVPAAPPIDGAVLAPPGAVPAPPGGVPLPGPAPVADPSAPGAPA